jgi:hypothetical protein
VGTTFLFVARYLIYGTSVEAISTRDVEPTFGGAVFVD